MKSQSLSRHGRSSQGPKKILTTASVNVRRIARSESPTVHSLPSTSSTERKIKNNRYIDDVAISALPFTAIQSANPTTIHDSPVVQIKRLPSYLRAITPIGESHSDWLAPSTSDKRKQHYRRRRRRCGLAYSGWCCCCCAGGILALIVILAGLTALLIALLTNKGTTTTTTSSTSTTSTSTTSATTTSSSTSSTSTTSSSTSTTSSTSETTTTTSSTATTTTTPVPPCTPNPVGSASTLLTASSGTTSSYACYAYEWIPTISGTVTLTFSFQHNPSYWFLDDVSVYNGAIQMLSNGDFESGSFSPGWTRVAPTGCGSGTTGYISSSYRRTGSYGYADGCNSHTDQLSQSFVATAGQSYIVSFWLKSGANGSGVSISVTLS
ncbi:unnamed protein product [Adineta ricciae]|uniref:Uncharacterized protein n=1 Tax=Adineta ricciae TaxID=249248 RepID=A0A815JLP9_ADIRI|nr:unnamed protein product [Adineta ricciae]